VSKFLDLKFIFISLLHLANNKKLKEEVKNKILLTIDIFINYDKIIPFYGIQPRGISWQNSGGVMDKVQLFYHNADGVNEEEDLSLPFLLVGYFRPPEFLLFAFITIYGGSEIIKVRGSSAQVLEEFIEKYGLRSHTRLRKLTMTGPENFFWEYSR